MSEKQRQSSKLLEPGIFYVCKNAATPIIAMLGCLELDMEISDAGMETMEFNDCRGMSRKDGERTEMLMVCWLQYEKGQDFSEKIDGSLSTYLPSQSVDCIR